MRRLELRAEYADLLRGGVGEVGARRAHLAQHGQRLLRGAPVGGAPLHRRAPPACPTPPGARGALAREAAILGAERRDALLHLRDQLRCAWRRRDPRARRAAAAVRVVRAWRAAAAATSSRPPTTTVPRPPTTRRERPTASQNEPPGLEPRNRRRRAAAAGGSALDVLQLLGAEPQRLQRADQVASRAARARRRRRRPTRRRPPRPPGRRRRRRPGCSRRGRALRLARRHLRVVQLQPAAQLVRALRVRDREQPQVLQRVGVGGCPASRARTARLPPQRCAGEKRRPRRGPRPRRRACARGGAAAAFAGGALIDGGVELRTCDPSAAPTTALARSRRPSRYPGRRTIFAHMRREAVLDDAGGVVVRAADEAEAVGQQRQGASPRLCGA